MYVEQGVAFLTDLSDSVQAYEDRGKAKQKPSTQYERGMEALSGMERLQQVEVLTGKIYVYICVDQNSIGREWICTWYATKYINCKSRNIPGIISLLSKIVLKSLSDFVN